MRSHLNPRQFYLLQIQQFNYGVGAKYGDAQTSLDGLQEHDQ